MGGMRQDLNLAGRPPIAIMLSGLQGSGKTTTAGKLALWLKEKNFRPALVSADVYRPAAIEQLHKVGGNSGVEVFPSDPGDGPGGFVLQAWEWAATRVESADHGYRRPATYRPGTDGGIEADQRADPSQ